ncbi:MAG: dicarboxylate/amino acid:cation symporter [Parachlamydiaceae bacterium]|nr:dicarboxylate/amino acid:cation symporter [Parachlamydiaceae bacterium]
MTRYWNSTFAMSLAVMLALLTGYLNDPTLNSVASAVSDIFMNLLKLVSVPIIFLSIVSTVSGMDNIHEFKNLGKRVMKFTLLTTVIAATLAFILFVTIDPVKANVITQETLAPIGSDKGYLTYLMQAIPSNVVHPFSESHVIGALVLALLFSLATLALPEHNRTVLHSLFSSLYAMIMKVTSWIVLLIPFAIWSFIALFIRDMREGLNVKSLALYLLCVVLANLIQALVVLPIFVKAKGLSPIRLAKGMFPALSLAFFSKSSSATLPLAMRCAEERLGISKKLAGFTFPLCTTINMNGCAAFIYITVLFVSMSNGMTFSLPEMVMWIFVATVAAVGNAGVPMGCFFLSGAFLAAMNVPLNLLGIILPFYALIDMLETVVNVWSDSCVVAVVDREVQLEQQAEQVCLASNS